MSSLLRSSGTRDHPAPKGKAIAGDANMDDLELRAQILAVITERTALGLRITTRALQERFQDRPGHQVRREAEWLSKQRLIQSRKGGYAARRSREGYGFSCRCDWKLLRNSAAPVDGRALGCSRQRVAHFYFRTVAPQFHPTQSTLEDCTGTASPALRTLCLHRARMRFANPA